MENGLREQMLLIREDVDKANDVADKILGEFVGANNGGSPTEDLKTNTVGLIGQSRSVHEKLNELNGRLIEIHMLLVGSPKPMPGPIGTYE